MSRTDEWNEHRRHWSLRSDADRFDFLCGWVAELGEQLVALGSQLDRIETLLEPVGPPARAVATVTLTP